ncbi:MAG: transcription antitermination factor NusB, partial [Coriobacteriales bacterium]
SRRQALQVMFQQEFVGRDIDQIDAGSKDLLVVSRCPKGVQDTDLVGEPLNDYAREVLQGVIAHREQIDGWIADAALNWTIQRMLNVDRNIIRMAAFEMAFVDEIPVPVAINEAVELAKVFGGDESPKFVNGILGRIATRMAEEGLIPAEELLGKDALEALAEQPAAEQATAEQAAAEQPAEEPEAQ